MAIYTFENESGEQETVHAPISEIVELEKEMKSKGFSRVYVPVRLVDGATGDIYSKSDDGWKETLKRVKKSSGKSNTIQGV